MSNKYNNGQYEGYASDDAILEAIEEIAGCDLLEDEDNAANKLWAGANAAQTAAILARAWELAAEDEEALCWGASTFKRA